MAAIEIPQCLQDLLQGSDFDSAVRDLVERTSEILADNKLAFFPDYTDHGVEHISAVLQSEVDLMPADVWGDVWGDASGGSSGCLLSAADAAIIVGATLLHDIAMHLTTKGFRELIEKDSRFEPLHWLKTISQTTLRTCRGMNCGIAISVRLSDSVTAIWERSSVKSLPDNGSSMGFLTTANRGTTITIWLWESSCDVTTLGWLTRSPISGIPVLRSETESGSFPLWRRSLETPPLTIV